MAQITIGDLERDEQLDRRAMTKIVGGRPGERPESLGTQLLRPRSGADLVPAIYDPMWRFDGAF